MSISVAWLALAHKTEMHGKPGPGQNVPATKRPLVKTSLTRTKRTRVLVRTYLDVSQNLVSWNSAAWIKYYGYNVYYNKYFMCYWDKLIIPWIKYYNTGVTETLTNIYIHYSVNSEWTVSVWIKYKLSQDNPLKFTNQHFLPFIDTLQIWRWNVSSIKLNREIGYLCVSFN